MAWMPEKKYAKFSDVPMVLLTANNQEEIMNVCKEKGFPLFLVSQLICFISKIPWKRCYRKT